MTGKKSADPVVVFWTSKSWMSIAISALSTYVCVEML